MHTAEFSPQSPGVPGSALLELAAKEKERRVKIEHFMQEAIRQAEDAWSSGEVPVGCVFVLNDEIIGSGRNRTNESLNGTRHAEFEAVDQILSSGRYDVSVFRDCELYVTVEPCVMCASALRQLGLRKVYYGCTNEKFGGCGGVFRINSDEQGHTQPPYVAEGGYMRSEAIMLLRRFYVSENEHAPVPKKKANRVLKPVDDQPI
ncbi:MAG: cytidine deaminase-like protein [Olpidium bornovanus]|uniref:tRNA(adenine(34)) deaminase n=1 Tax=Olpidium bornovanus TaxID=278681 RepID=A0A8H7ZNG6_9FUNG|nr:MAG: cytidine deaminase-like protein [Olpidium bornovanus]